MKSGAGTVTLGAANVFTGDTQLESGTLALSGGDNRLPTSTTLAFNPGNVSNAAAALALGSTNQTVSALTFPTGGSFPATAMAMAVTGTGTLTVNGSNDLIVGAGGTASLNNATAFSQQLDMSGLNNFVYNNSAGIVEFALTGNRATKATNVATVKFATHNTITSQYFGIADNGGGAGGGNTIVRLGQTNVWNTDELDIGTTRADADVQFSSGLVNPSITIRAADGASPIPLILIGHNNDNSSSRTWDDVVDFSAGTTDLLASTMIIGMSQPSSTSRSGHVNGTFVLGAGNVTVTDLNIGVFNPTAAGNGTTSAMDNTGKFTLNNAAGTLNATTVSLASVPQDVATRARRLRPARLLFRPAP